MLDGRTSKTWKSVTYLLQKFNEKQKIHHLSINVCRERIPLNFFPFPQVSHANNYLLLIHFFILFHWISPSFSFNVSLTTGTCFCFARILCFNETIDLHGLIVRGHFCLFSVLRNGPPCNWQCLNQKQSHTSQGHIDNAWKQAWDHFKNLRPKKKLQTQGPKSPTAFLSQAPRRAPHSNAASCLGLHHEGPPASLAQWWQVVAHRNPWGS